MKGKEGRGLTNSHVRSHRATTVLKPGFTLVFTNASNNVTCFSTSPGFASASASSLDMFATTEGGGRELGRRKRDARENDREVICAGEIGALG